MTYTTNIERRTVCRIPARSASCTFHPPHAAPSHLHASPTFPPSPPPPTPHASPQGPEHEVATTEQLTRNTQRWKQRLEKATPSQEEMQSHSDTWCGVLHRGHHLDRACFYLMAHFRSARRGACCRTKSGGSRGSSETSQSRERAGG